MRSVCLQRLTRAGFGRLHMVRGDLAENSRQIADKSSALMGIGTRFRIAVVSELLVPDGHHTTADSSEGQTPWR